MNILLVSQNFTKGGLETRVDTFSKLLSPKNNIYFAFGTYEDNGYIKDFDIDKDFCLKESSTIEEFIEDVEKLVSIIKNKKIDIVCAEPFHSLFPAVFAAHLCNVPITYTVHGRVSLNFPKNINDSILFYYGLESLINSTFSVSKNYIKWIEKYSKNDNIYFSPNVVNETIYKEIKSNDSSNKWAMITRIDEDKINEIIEILNLVKENVISSVDIYGSGQKESLVKKYISKFNLDKKVSLKGYVTNVYEKINGEYSGVIATGRSAIEGLICNIPVLFVGYGKIIGLIDKNTYNEYKDSNFVSSDVKPNSKEKIIEQIKDCKNDKYKLRKQAIKDFGISNLEEFNNYLKQVKQTKNPIIEKAFDDIKRTNNKKELFYKSDDIFKILVNYIYNNTFNLELNELITNYNNTMGLSYIVYKDKDSLKNSVDYLKHKVINQQKQIDSLNEMLQIEKNKSIITLFKRDLRKIKNKIFKKER